MAGKTKGSRVEIKSVNAAYGDAVLTDIKENTGFRRGVVSTVFGHVRVYVQVNPNYEHYDIIYDRKWYHKFDYPKYPARTKKAMMNRASRFAKGVANGLFTQH